MATQQIEKQSMEDLTNEIYWAYSTGEIINRFQQGLCATCIHQKNCTLTSSKTVQWCDEFCAGPAPAKKETKNVRNTALTSQNDKTIVYQGLCVNCEHRFDCPSSRKEGGIWYCEEYC